MPAVKRKRCPDQNLVFVHIYPKLKNSPFVRMDHFCMILTNIYTVYIHVCIYVSIYIYLFIRLYIYIFIHFVVWFN